MKFFIFLKLFIFEKLLIFECSILEYIANITFQQFTKRCFALWLYKTMGQRKKKEERTLLRKKAREKQNSVTIMISAERKGTVFPVKLKLEGESFE